jgi:ParB-like chromosome segregation protein Spo0J
MQIQMIPISNLKPAEYNPRKISDWEMRKLMRSLENFDIVENVVVNADMTIISGHQRVEAAKNLGMESVPCNVLNLSKKKEKALNLRMNKGGGEWDNDKLVAAVIDLDESDRIDSGFDEAETSKLLGQEIKKQEEMLSDQSETSTCPTCGQKVKGE